LQSALRLLANKAKLCRVVRAGASQRTGAKQTGAKRTETKRTETKQTETKRKLACSDRSRIETAARGFFLFGCTCRCRFTDLVHCARTQALSHITRHPRSTPSPLPLVDPRSSSLSLPPPPRLPDPPPSYFRFNPPLPLSLPTTLSPYHTLSLPHSLPTTLSPYHTLSLALSLPTTHSPYHTLSLPHSLPTTLSQDGSPGPVQDEGKHRSGGHGQVHGQNDGQEGLGQQQPDGGFTGK